MNKDEFIHYIKGIVDSEIEKGRIEALKLNKQSVEWEMTGPLRLIKDALDKVEMSEPKPTLGCQVPICTSVPDEVPYNEICPCNPKNGGNGICGCVLPNKMVPNPKKYTHPVSNWGTTTSTEIKTN